MEKHDKQASFSVDDNLDKSMDKISADMEVADMGKHDKHESFSEGDNLDKSEEVSSTQKKGRRTFRKLVGDFFDDIHSAIFATWVGTAFLILAVTGIALILLGAWVCSMGWASFAEDNSYTCNNCCNNCCNNGMVHESHEEESCEEESCEEESCEEESCEEESCEENE